ncbi:MFS transporter [Sciscionella sediminilitoris]|uniref:MFS transporter n=1 Tax=Sciscionella sediminilitoris TaxID=1445613 RepID=UPI00068F5BE2|nr:MFS transporter [Sciscionella sp. SE31]
MTTTPLGTRSAAPPAARRELLAATAGALVEGYDWGIYSTLAVYYSVQVFPGQSPTAKLLLAFASFAAGFLMRPFGSALFGRISDTKGRRFALTLGMAVASLALLFIAVVPTYAAIGAASPIIVVLARLVQGLAMGGEKAIAATYVVETAPPRRRFTYAAIAYCGDVLSGIVGFGTTALLLAIFGSEGMTNGAWRISFGFGALLGITALWIRSSAKESAVFLAHRNSAREPRTRALLRANARSVCAVFLLVIGGTTSYYFGVTYLPQYAWRDLGVLSDTAADAYINIAFVAMFAAMLVSGRLADRFGPLRVTRAGIIAVAVCTVPLMLALRTGALPFFVVAPLYLIVIAFPIGISNVFYCQLFPTAIRSIGMGIPNAVAVAAFGGTLPMVATALGEGGNSILVPWLITAAAVIAFGGSLLVPAVHHRAVTAWPEAPAAVPPTS